LLKQTLQVKQDHDIMDLSLNDIRIEFSVWRNLETSVVSSALICKGLVWRSHRVEVLSKPL